MNLGKMNACGGAKPVGSSDADLKGHFANVKSFGDHELARERRSRRVAWTVAAAASASAVVLAFAIAALAPLKTVEKIAFRVDNTTGAVERIYDLEKVPLTSADASNRFFVWQYVRTRESFYPAEAKANYDTVSLMSTAGVQGEYFEATRGGNPDSPQVRLGPNGAASVRWVSTSFLNPKLAQVRFVVTEKREGVVSAPRNMVATIGFDFAPGKIKGEDINTNPLGFVVTSYHADVEAGR